MKIFILLIIFQIKHFLADYPLQNAYMLGKFKDKGWIIPLAAHAGVHILFTFLISIFFAKIETVLLLSIFDFIIHFTMDRIKASPKMLGRFNGLSKDEFLVIKNILSDSKTNNTQWRHNINRIKSNTYFWYSVGFDQMIHHLTHYIIIYFLVN